MITKLPGFKTILFSTAIVFGANALNAQVDINLDTSFDADGFNTLAFSDDSSTAESAVIQSNGKIVVGAFSENDTTEKSKFAVARFNTDGSLDTSFGNSGKVETAVSSDSNFLFDININSSGKIFAAGYSGSDTGFNLDATIVSYNADGSLNTAFSGDGILVDPLDANTATAITSVKVLSDGKLVVAGLAIQKSDTEKSNIYVAKYNADGTIDTSFGTNGKTVTNLNNFDRSEKVIIQSDGKILVYGSTEISSTVYELVVLRYNANGTLDSSFGTNGIYTSNFNKDSAELGDIKLDANEKIVITSTLENATADIVILRLNTNGTLDTSFGANGTTITDFNGNTEFAGSIYIQNSGKILTTNSISYATSGSNADILFIQYNEDGTLDGGFNSDGIKTSDLGENEYLTSAMSDNNGKLVVLGEQESTTSGNGLSIFVARYEIDNSLSVENFSLTDVVTVFPNPVQTKLEINLTDNLQLNSVAIFNILGKKVLETTTKNVDFSKLNSGIYLAKISTDKGNITKKIIKK